MEGTVSKKYYRFGVLEGNHVEERFGLDHAEQLKVSNLLTSYFSILRIQDLQESPKQKINTISIAQCMVCLLKPKRTHLRKLII